MTIAKDVATSLGSGTGSRSFSHAGRAAGSGGVQGAVVIVTGNDGTQVSSAVTYGGVAMTFVGAARLAGTLEPGSAEAWFLGASVPAGTQTVSITSSAGTYSARCFSVTASADTMVDTWGGGAWDGGSAFEVPFDNASFNAPTQEVFVASGLHSSTNSTTGIGGGAADVVKVDLGASATGSGSLDAIQPAGVFTHTDWNGSFPGEHEVIVTCIGLLVAGGGDSWTWGDAGDSWGVFN